MSTYLVSTFCRRYTEKKFVNIFKNIPQYLLKLFNHEITPKETYVRRSEQELEKGTNTINVENNDERTYEFIPIASVLKT